MWQMAMLECKIPFHFKGLFMQGTNWYLDHPPSVFIENEGNPYKNKYVSGLDPRLTRGPTFGKPLERSSYSKELKVLILWCLMDVLCCVCCFAGSVLPRD